MNSSNSSVDDSWRLLAAWYLRRQVKQLAGQLDGVRRGEDIEFVHRARVASRRLRAALKVFADCFPAGSFKTRRKETCGPGNLKRWRKAIRRLTKGLGDARAEFVNRAKAATVVSHANVATLFEVGDGPDELFLVFEFVPGQPFDRSPEETRQAGEVLARFHQLTDAFAGENSRSAPRGICRELIERRFDRAGAICGR